jgi:hypothetical protein
MRLQMSDVRNVDEFRSKIDSGQTGDKMPWSDPAAAPLGTDDEAAGTPPTRAQVAMAYRQEAGRPVSSRSPVGRGLGVAWWMVGITIVIALSIICVPFFLP